MIYHRIQHEVKVVMDQLIGTWHPHHRDQGPKGVDHVHLGALGDHLQGYVGYISRFVRTPRSGFCYWLGPGTHTTGTRDQKVISMCILEHLRTIYRVVWGSFRKISASYFSTHTLLGAVCNSWRGVQQWQKESYLILRVIEFPK